MSPLGARMPRMARHDVYAGSRVGESAGLGGGGSQN